MEVSASAWVGVMTSAARAQLPEISVAAMASTFTDLS